MLDCEVDSSATELKQVTNSVFDNVEKWSLRSSAEVRSGQLLVVRTEFFTPWEAWWGQHLS